MPWKGGKGKGMLREGKGAMHFTWKTTSWGMWKEIGRRKAAWKEKARGRKAPKIQCKKEEQAAKKACKEVKNFLLGDLINILEDDDDDESNENPEDNNKETPEEDVNKPKIKEEPKSPKTDEKK